MLTYLSVFLLPLSLSPFSALAQSPIDEFEIEMEIVSSGRSLASTYPEARTFKPSLFDAAYENGGVVLYWTTGGERNNARFEIEKSIRSHKAGLGSWSTITFISGNGTTDSLSTYSFHDKSDFAGVSQVFYRLKQVNFDGTYGYSEPLEATLPAPKTFAVSSYNQPYELSATIEFDVPKSTRVRLTVYDAEGRHQQTLVNQKLMPGRYREVFDASNLDPGLYIYRLEARGRSWVEPILLVR